jgi:hypothetical protein
MIFGLSSSLNLIWDRTGLAAVFFNSFMQETIISSYVLFISKCRIPVSEWHSMCCIHILLCRYSVDTRPYASKGSIWVSIGKRLKQE